MSFLAPVTVQERVDEDPEPRGVGGHWDEVQTQLQRSKPVETGTRRDPGKRLNMDQGAGPSSARAACMDKHNGALLSCPAGVSSPTGDLLCLGLLL